MQLAAGAAPEEEAEEEDGELTQAAVSAALQQEGIGAAMQLCALGGGGIDDAAAFAEQLMASFGGGSQGGGGGQGGGGQDGSDPAVQKCAEQLHAAALQLRRQQQQQQTAAGAPGGVSPGGGGGWCIFFFGRASSTESPGGLGSTLGGQVAILGAAAVALPGIKAGSELLIRIQVWLETCSTYQHPPADRKMLVAMLAAARPGDVVVVASQCRLARQPAQLRAILQVARELGVSVFVAAVGSLPAPLLAALEHDGLLADTPHTAEQRRVVAATAAGAAAASQRAWALSAQHGLHAAQHAFQPRVQHGFMGSVLSTGLAASVQQYSLNGVSISNAAAQSTGPLLQLLHSLAMRGKVAVFTTLDRLARSPQALQQQVAAARDEGMALVVLAPSLRVMLALAAGSSFAEGALGSALHATVSGLPGGEQVLAAFEAHAVHAHSFMHLQRHNTPALVPVVLTLCSARVLDAAAAETAEGAAFASGRQASYSGVVHPAAAAAAAAGKAAFLLTAPASGGGQRGLSVGQLEAAVAACKAAATAQAGGSLPRLSVSLGNWGSGQQWACRSCDCSADSPDPACLCGCAKCRLAAESLCGCPAACSRGGECECPPGCSCACLACHRYRSSGGSGGGGGSSGGGGGGSRANPLCLVCAAPLSRPSQKFCNAGCYATGAELGGWAPLTCPRGSACKAAQPPGLVPPGMAHGLQHCEACFYVAKGERRRSALPAVAAPAAAREPGGGGAAAAGAAAGAAAAPAAAAGGDGGTRKRKSPEKENAKEAVKWGAAELDLDLAHCVLSCARQAAADHKTLSRLSWKLAQQPVLIAASPQQLSGRWRRLAGWAELGLEAFCSKSDSTDGVPVWEAVVAAAAAAAAVQRKE
ncbi:hypothetical protein C2E20_0761 [Micractinium conductrix]|uniref:Resolvase/invertase-type recombinase catalytic domain-containing protein n=1 Tax=Micractinium conductrix TaxID=554055 RepID=A0A2P6VS54_9CHLO|nr:hypothetical protein C2E20_0761 [Micractinium conductrix]|eukprot:PSC76926.1 hypothetical protein C2E20_0761 [Micractinium conductrix]